MEFQTISMKASSELLKLSLSFYYVGSTLALKERGGEDGVSRGYISLGIVYLYSRIQIRQTMEI